MTTLRSALVLAFVPFWLGLPRPASGAEVRIRVIDARNGKPYARLGILVTLIKAKLDPGQARGLDSRNVLGERRAITDPQGKATIDVTPPFPMLVEVSPGRWTLEARKQPLYYELPEQLDVMLGNGLVGCGEAFFDMKEVLTKGVVGINECRTKWAKKVEFEAKPGEMVLFAAPLSFWERLFWP
jgi:hypothetical protein